MGKQMPDITARLTTWCHAPQAESAQDLMDEAAREIERLRCVTEPLPKEKRAEVPLPFTDEERRDMGTDNTQGGNEPSLASAGSRPVAWAALNDDGDIAWIGYTEEGAADGACGRTIVPLYTHPVPPDRPVGLGFDDMRLTDEEREAIEKAISRELDCDWYGGPEPARVVTLRGMLERLG